MTDIFYTLQKAFPVLAIIFISVFALILLIRLILTLLIHFALKKYRKLKNSLNNLKKKEPPKYEKEEEELLRQIPKAHSATRASNLVKQKMAQNDSYELMASDEQNADKEVANEVKIVDMVKPIGFWTSVILGQKLTYLIKSAQIINKRGKQGFWVSMIEAQEQAAGRQHSRSR